MTSIEEIKLSYGINKAIDGEYDKTAAAKCANGTFVGKRFGDVVEFRGNPSVVGINWKRYTVPERATMILDKNPRLKNDILKKQRKLLFPLLRYMINASYTSLDYNVPFVRKVVAGAAAAAIGTAVGIVALRKLFKD